MDDANPFGKEKKKIENGTRENINLCIDIFSISVFDWISISFSFSFYYRFYALLFGCFFSFLL